MTINGSRRLNCGTGDGCCESVGMDTRSSNAWVRQKIAVAEENGLLE